MSHQSTRYPYTAFVVAGLFALSGCVSIAAIEPIKNPPTKFRSDNVVDVEFLNPARVGLRCGERGTQAFGMPVFHAMACGNGKLITMPDPCLTFTGGDYASLICDQRSRPASAPAPVPEWQALLQPASYPSPARAAPTPLKPRAGASIPVEFVHPSAVLQRCSTRGLEVSVSDDSGLASCGDAEMMTVPNPCMILEAGWYPRTLCHEMAHANGWSMDHPGGSFLSDARAGVDPDDVPPPRAVLASLASSAPLRPASASPAYLAFVAAKTRDVRPPDYITLPLVFAALPEGGASRIDTLMDLPDVIAPGAGSALLDFASLQRTRVHRQTAFLMSAAAPEEGARALRGRLMTTASATNLPAPGLLLASAGRHQVAALPRLQPIPAPPHHPAEIWLAAAVRERAGGALTSAAKWLSAALPDDPAMAEAITARLIPAVPTPPSAKPMLNRPWREEEGSEIGTGV